MNEVLNKSYEMNYDNLIVSSKHESDVNVVKVASGQGVLRRGTVLSLTSESNYVVCGSDIDDNVIATANCIISDSVDTGTEAGSEVPVVVYISGNMNVNALIVADGYKLSDADKENLRNAGLFLTSSNTI